MRELMAKTPYNSRLGSRQKYIEFLALVRRVEEIHQPSVEPLCKNVKVYKGSLPGLFCWSGTEQGHEYWYTLYNLLSGAMEIGRDCCPVCLVGKIERNSTPVGFDLIVYQEACLTCGVRHASIYYYKGTKLTLLSRVAIPEKKWQPEKGKLYEFSNLEDFRVCSYHRFKEMRGGRFCTTDGYNYVYCRPTMFTAEDIGQ
jgi:hypothetical protein